jgi:1-acyl-sn-glycerol-3-phosphate acyltransferase
MFYKIAYVLVRFTFCLLFRIRVRGRENIPAGAAVVCANHTASTDPVFLAFAMTLRHPIFFMAKAELLNNPLQRLVLNGLGVFAVHRGQSDVKAIKQAFRLLRAGKKLGMFPEGTRVQNSDTAEARTGAAMLAVRTGAPLLPVAISPGRKHLFSKVNIVIGPAYTLEDKKATPERYREIADELMKRIYQLDPCHAL